MQNEKAKIKQEFKKRLYDFTLRLIDFLDKLLKDNVSRRIGDQLLRSGTSIIANYIEGQAASSALAKLMLGADDMSSEERVRVRQNLLEYCKMDTWGLVKMLDCLKNAGSHA